MKTDSESGPSASQTLPRLPALLPVLPIRNAVLFPWVSMPLVVGRVKSLEAVRRAEAGDQLILIITQKQMTPGDPSASDLYSIGTLAKVEIEPQNPADGPVDPSSRQIIVTGLARYRVLEILDRGDHLEARGEIQADLDTKNRARNQALFTHLKTLAGEVLELLPGSPEPLLRLLEKIDDAGALTHLCAAYLNLPLQQKQSLLENRDLDSRMEQLLETMQKEKEVLGLQHEIRGKLSERLSKAQREALLREQLRTIRAELGEEATEETADELTQRIADAKLPPEAAQQAQEELKRLRALPPSSAEYQVVRNYLEWLASLPWSVSTPDQLDLARAKQILEEDHSGLDAVKKRILQFLAVAKLKNDLHGPILCLVGPPGVGKTSLGQSIAKTVGRKFIRASLGGVRDEAEIRGHRRTYVGAMPGRIIQSIKRAASRNPVLLLDEIDKLRADFHGDPSAAMLEVLDPEQNKSFVDHYLDVPFNLSDVFFIATANRLDTIPPPLLDRMEIIEVNGYTTAEKLEIAKKHLLPRELEAHGLRAQDVQIPEATLEQVISHHTREAGVRDLRRKIAALLRSAAEDRIREIEKAERETHRGEPSSPGEPKAALELAPILISPESLKDRLGPERYFPEKTERVLRPGVVTGLAWTPHGGDILYIEVSRMPGKGQLILTGQLGEVMKESAQIALSLARQAPGGGAVSPWGDFANWDIHIHVPAGAIPKDGPSAGVTLFVALASLVREQAIPPRVCMTGEITLRGAVLPVGGIKEKVLAAHRAQMQTVILPKRNEQDLREVPENVRKALQFVFVETTDEALTAALQGTLEAGPETEVAA